MKFKNNYKNIVFLSDKCYTGILYNIIQHMKNYNDPSPKITYEQSLYSGQNERVDELNNRIYERYITETPLEPNYDPRPVPTKYVVFPIMDKRPLMKQPKQQYMDYNTQTQFNPGNRISPFSGNNIDLENNLRNQYFSIQHGAPQGIYIPSSNSDLYKNSVISRPTHQPHPELFNTYKWSSSPHPNVANSLIGRDPFFNHTRTQLRNS